LLNRTLVVFVPMILVLIPGMRSIPAIYRWQMRWRIFRWYRALMVLEKDMAKKVVNREELLQRLENIENVVNKMKVPAFLADQFYGLRGDINFVRQKLTNVRSNKV